MLGHILPAALLLGLCATLVVAAAGEPALTPPRKVIELAVGEKADIVLADGTTAAVKLLGIDATMDALDSGVREGRARVEVNGQQATLISANYTLPVTVGGVRIDCPITRSWYASTNADRWGLGKDARLRLWPVRGPLLAPGTFGYPVRQKWFASDTQMANEPVFVDAGERGRKKLYYHSGLDFGGVEGMVDILAATDGLVVSAGGKTLPDYKEGGPVGPRYDVVYVVDGRGWFYRYSHLKEIDAAVRPGVRVTMGQKVGILGKEGGSGGWSHVHFEIKTRQPSGKWGTEEAYAYVWEAYAGRYKPPVVAVARPHRFVAVGEEVVLDGRRSRAFGARVDRYEWTLTDGARAIGPTVKQTYSEPGTYCEILKVTDTRGNSAWDFCVVQVVDPKALDRLPPTVHAAYAPTQGIKVGDPVTFKARSFRTKATGETWDFGDGSPKVNVKSDANANVHDPNGYGVTVHRYTQPGDYIATVRHTAPNGYKAVGRVWVHVEGA